NVPADDCVDLTGRLPILDVRLHTLNILDSFCGRTTLQGSKGRVVEVHRDDRAIRTDKTRREEGDVTNTATKIQNVHPRGYSCTAEELFGKGIQQRRLKYQTTAFAVIMTHHISGGVRHAPSLAGSGS